MSKIRDSGYTSGRGLVKKACAQRETLPIAGFALKANRFNAHLCRPAKWQGTLCRQGRSRL